MRTMIAAAALALCSGALFAQDLKGAEKALLQALKDQNRKGVETAVAALLTADSADAMKILLGAISKPPARDSKKDAADDPAANECALTLLNAAASFQDPAALGLLAEFIIANKAKPVSRDAMAAVCNHANKPLVALCFKVLEGAANDDVKLMAVDQILSLGDKTSVEPLVKAMKANEKSTGGLLLRIGRALTVLTGQDYADSVTNWTGWWEANKDKDWKIKEASASGSTGTVTDSL
ncbi:MAG: hypothetical protein HY293_18000, partial [Planctomycetes bacterium]|nr:hypothetical protein [Planctomycetota bacterium]